MAPTKVFVQAQAFKCKATEEPERLRAHRAEMRMLTPRADRNATHCARCFAAKPNTKVIGTQTKSGNSVFRGCASPIGTWGCSKLHLPARFGTSPVRGRLSPSCSEVPLCNPKLG